MGIDNRKEISVLVSLKIKTKKELLLFLAKELCFPNYFGNNWDALYDCLTDLNWLEQNNITIIHEKGFMLSDITDMETYQSILKQVIEQWNISTEKKVKFIFQ